jgi:methylaspartate mutase epsilon subunit
LIPPCIALTTSLIDALLGIEQGVKDVIVSYGVSGHLVQDVAGIQALRELGQERIAASGHTDVRMYVVTPQWMGDFPQDESLAYSVVAYSSLAAVLGGTNLIVTKSTDEALGVPSPAANEAGVKATRGMVAIMGGQRLQSPALDEEKARIKTETNAILDAALELGGGDMARAAVTGVAAGVIDVPFSPSRNNAGRVIVGRDLEGAVRFLDTGDLPFPPDIVRFHRERMEERVAAFGGPRSDMLAEDIFHLSKTLERYLVSA